MKRRNFLKWLIAVPAGIVASKLPVSEKQPYSASKIVIEEWNKYHDQLRRYFQTDLRNNEFVISENVYNIITGSSDNIEEFIKS